MRTEVGILAVQSDDGLAATTVLPKAGHALLEARGMGATSQFSGIPRTGKPYVRFWNLGWGRHNRPQVF